MTFPWTIVLYRNGHGHWRIRIDPRVMYEAKGVPPQLAPKFRIERGSSGQQQG